jgi:hypothetical protein
MLMFQGEIVPCRFLYEDRYVFTWRELETPDVFAGVKLLIGKDTVDKELKARRRRKTAQAKR